MKVSSQDWLKNGRLRTHKTGSREIVRLLAVADRILASAEAARLAVGYFFLSGLTSIAEKLADVKELRLLIGITTLRRLAEGWPSPTEAVSAPPSPIPDQGRSE